MKLKYRLSLSFLVVVTLGAAMTFILVQRSTETMFRSFVFSGDSDKAKVYAGILGDYYRTEGNWNDVQQFLQDLPLLVSEKIDTRLHGERKEFSLPSYPASTLRALLADRVVIADSNGIIVADTAGQLTGSVHPHLHLSHGIPVMVKSGQTGTVLVGSMIDSALTGVAERYLRSITASMLFSTLLSVLAALLLGLLFAMHITKPLASLARAAKKVASGEPLSPVAVEGNDELSDLSKSFNEMTAELRRLDGAKKQIIADSAHELRTPVTLIRGTIEGMIDGIFPLDVPTLKSVHEETLRLSRLIDTLRELEIIESGELELSREGVDIREMITKAVSLFTSAAIRKSIALSYVTCGENPPVASGDAVRLAEVVYNLVTNALTYAPVHGMVLIREEAGDDEYIQFSVDDSGPGIALSERPHIFERFYRIDKSRSTESGGRGLGLAIASEIVKAHGGTITVGTADLGGARFTVRIPRTHPPA